MDEEIKKVLAGFISEMNKWELDCAKMDDDIENETSSIDEDEAERIQGDNVEAIFSKYCTPKERKFGRIGMYQRPPAYDPSEEVLEITYPNPKKAVVATQAKTGFRHKNRYTLFYKNDQWQIDYKEYWAASQEKWAKAVL